MKIKWFNAKLLEKFKSILPGLFIAGAAPVAPAKVELTLPFEIYDHEFKRATGFGYFETAEEAQAFINRLSSPRLRADYSVRAIPTRMGNK